LFEKLYKLFGFPIFLFSASPDEAYSRNASCAL